MEERIKKINSQLNPIIERILLESLESNFLVNRIKSKIEGIFSESIKRTYNSRLKESRDLKIDFDKDLSLRLSLESGINRLILSIKEELKSEEVSDYLINKISRDLNNQLKGNLKLKMLKILSGQDNELIKESIADNRPDKSIQSNQNYFREDFYQRINNSRNLELKRFFNSEEGKRFLTNLSELKDLELIDKLFSNNLSLLESIINVSFSIDCKDKNPLDIISKSMGLLKMISFNPRVMNSLEKRPKLLNLFKDKRYDSIAGTNAKDLSDIFVAIPNRISKSNQGQINISNHDYSRLNDKTRKYIDDYRTIMSDYYPENLVDVFESKVYSAIANNLNFNSLDEFLRIKLIEHFSNYYLDIFNSRRNKNIYENKMNSELSKYFIFNSSTLNAHKYALRELNRYILSEGLMDKLKKSIFGGKVSSGMAGKINNWFKNTSVMKFMKKVSNAMDGDIEEWEKKLNPNQKKIFNEYPHLKAVFASGGLDTNLATHLIQNKSMLKLLNNYPNLSVIIAENPKVADLLLKRDKRLLPKILENPEIFDWLEDNEQLAGKILNGNDSYLQVLQACILNFNLATKIANDNGIISDIGLDNLVDLAELMNSSSDLADLLDQLDPKEFKGLAKVLFEKPEVLDFLQSNNKGKLLVKIAKSDTSDTIVKAIMDNPDNFTEDSDITKIEGNDNYNKILNKHIAKFKSISSNKDKGSGDNNGGELHQSNTPESKYVSIWTGLGSDKKDAVRDFVQKYKADDCAIINLEDLKQDSSVVPQVSDEVNRDEVLWIYPEGGKFKVVINARKIAKIKANSDFGYKYIFDFEGSKSEGNSIVSIEPAIFKKEGNNYSLVKKGKLKLDNIS